MRASLFLIAGLLAGSSALAQQPTGPAEEQATDLSAVVAVARRDRIALTAAEYAALRAVDRGAPHYSIEQIASFICESKEPAGVVLERADIPRSMRNQVARELQERSAQRGAGIDEARARAAFAATEAFEDTKRRLRAAEATMDDLLAAEDRRQRAVLAMYSRDFSALSEIAQTAVNGLRIEGAGYRVALVEGEQVMVASVSIRNEGRQSREIPPVTIKSLDRAGRVLADTTYHADPPAVLAAGQSRSVEIAFKNMPYYTHQMRAHFGPGGFSRNTRACPEAQRFHPPGGLRLDLAANDAEQRMVDAVLGGGYSPGVLVQVDGARWAEGTAGRVLEISAVLSNPTPTPLAFPAFSIVLKGPNGAEMARSSAAANGEMIAANANRRLTLRLRNVEAFDLGSEAGLSERISVILD